MTALKYFLSQKRDLLSDISGIVSHWRDLLSDMSQKRDLLSDIVSQKRALLSDCQWGLRTDRMTMRGEGLSCYVQLKISVWP